MNAWIHIDAVNLTVVYIRFDLKYILSNVCSLAILQWNFERFRYIVETTNNISNWLDILHVGPTELITKSYFVHFGMPNQNYSFHALARKLQHFCWCSIQLGQHCRTLMTKRLTKVTLSLILVLTKKIC